jgi:hypothetical protein
LHRWEVPKLGSKINLSIKTPECPKKRVHWVYPCLFFKLVYPSLDEKRVEFLVKNMWNWVEMCKNGSKMCETSTRKYCSHDFTIFLRVFTAPASPTTFARLQHCGGRKTREIVRSHDLTRTLNSHSSSNPKSYAACNFNGKASHHTTFAIIK